MKIQTWLLLVLWMAVSVSVLFAAEQENGHGPGHHHNMVELFLGNTYEDSDHGSENGFTVGLVYERRLSDRFGIAGMYEYTAGDFDKWSIALPLFVYPFGDWRLATGAGARLGTPGKRR